MFFLRVGRRARWKDRSPDNAEDVAEAMLDLMERDDNDHLSVFAAKDAAEAKTVAAYFGAACRESPGQLDYVLIPEDCLSDVRVAPQPSDGLPPELSRRHHELMDLDDEVRRVLAARILRSSPIADRIQEREMVKLVVALLESDDTLSAHLSERWLARVAVKR